MTKGKDNIYSEILEPKKKKKNHNRTNIRSHIPKKGRRFTGRDTASIQVGRGSGWGSSERERA